MTTSIMFNIGDSEIQGNDYFTVIEPVFWPLIYMMVPNVMRKI